MLIARSLIQTIPVLEFNLGYSRLTVLFLDSGSFADGSEMGCIYLTVSTKQRGMISRTSLCVSFQSINKMNEIASCLKWS